MRNHTTNAIEWQHEPDNNEEFELKEINTQLLVADPDYQRPTDAERVKRIAAQYNPALINFIKVSFRDGKYYVFDGLHTRALLIAMNGGRHLNVKCKMYRLTKEQEAELFAQQNGLSKIPTANYRFKAKYVAHDQDITNFYNITNATGLLMDFSDSKSNNRIVCVSKAYKAYKTLSATEYATMLRVIKNAWGGREDSLRQEIVGGMTRIMLAYRGQLDTNRLIDRLSQVVPNEIIREGKQYKGGDDRFARQILKAYNFKLKNKLPDAFN